MNDTYLHHFTSPAPATLAGAGLVLVVLLAYQYRQVPQWAARDIRPIVGWKIVAAGQVVAGLSATLAVTPVWGSAAGVAAAALGWLSVLAVATDLATRKVPWDASYPPLAVGLVCFAASYTFEGLLALGAALLGVVGVPFLARALTRKGLGMSDIRILAAAAATTSWWLGQTWLLYALIVACVGQLLIRFAIAPVLGWGTQVPVPGHDTRTRLELPFAPALVLALWAFIAYGTYTGYGACAMWNPFGCA